MVTAPQRPNATALIPNPDAIYQSLTSLLYIYINSSIPPWVFLLQRNFNNLNIRSHVKSQHPE
jgi:hypothetical protein